MTLIKKNYFNILTLKLLHIRYIFKICISRKILNKIYNFKWVEHIYNIYNTYIMHNMSYL